MPILLRRILRKQENSQVAELNTEQVNTPLELTSGSPWGWKCGKELQKEAQLERERGGLFVC